MKIYNILFAILLSVSILFVSCSDTYLDTYPTNSTGSSTAFETTENAALVINGIYRLMVKQYFSTQAYGGEGTIKAYYGDWMGNDMSYRRSSSAVNPLVNGELYESTSAMENYYPWYYYYRIISNANSVIEYIDGAKGKVEEKQFIKAQALTFRAYSFFMLSQFYCNRWIDSNNGATSGLVLRLDTSIDSMPLSTLAEVYKQVYDDLDEAIGLFDESKLSRPTGGDNSTYHLDKEVAYAIYARAALTRQDYKTAAGYAVKARAGYPLMNVSEYQSGFNQPNSEWIWSSYGSTDQSISFYAWHALIGYNSTAGNVRSYPKSIATELLAKIPETDIRKPMFLDPTGFAYNAKTHAADKDLDAHARSLYPALQSNANIYAYMQFKISTYAQPGVGHMNHFRSSEMFLIEAEAEYFLNNEDATRSLLLQLTRDSGRDPSYTCNKSGTALLEEIKLYRSIELWGEGFNWFDLKRWGDPIRRISMENGGSFVNAHAITATPESRNKWTWKIPERETNYNDEV